MREGTESEEQEQSYLYLRISISAIPMNEIALVSARQREEKEGMIS